MKTLRLLLIVLPICSLLNGQPNLVIEVKGGKYPRYHTPVYVHLPTAMNIRRSYQLLDRKTGKMLPAQLTDSVTLVFIPTGTIAAGTSKFYILRSSGLAFLKNGVIVQEQEDGLLVEVKKKPLLFYHTKEAQPPPDSPSYYRRSGFIHPLYSPGGSILTDDFPAGHAHQHGIFLTWTNTTFRNSLLDFWNQHLRKGTVEHIKVLRITEGPVMTQIQARLVHKSLVYGDVLQDTWTITIYPFTDYFLFDLESEQHNVTADTLFLNKYHYGGLAFRGSRQWNPDDKDHFRSKWNILTSEGIKDTMANQTHARWIDASGKIDGRVCGVTVFDHPSNSRYPQALRVHPRLPYWCYTPVADSGFTLLPSAPFRWRFRYLVHQGTPNSVLTDRILQDWIEPPESVVR